MFSECCEWFASLRYDNVRSFDIAKTTVDYQDGQQGFGPWSCGWARWHTAGRRGSHGVGQPWGHGVLQDTGGGLRRLQPVGRIEHIPRTTVFQAAMQSQGIGDNSEWPTARPGERRNARADRIPWSRETETQREGAGSSASCPQSGEIRFTKWRKSHPLSPDSP